MRFFIRLITALIVILYFSCGAKGPTWEQTLVKQTSAPGSLQAIDSFVLPIMKRYEIPGMSIAVAKDNRLLFAKGYGFADKSKKTETTASSLFRINTISGTITAIAIIKLIEQGKLSMQ